jgi:hypothetical protein
MRDGDDLTITQINGVDLTPGVSPIDTQWSGNEMDGVDHVLSRRDAGLQRRCDLPGTHVTDGIEIATETRTSR